MLNFAIMAPKDSQQHQTVLTARKQKAYLAVATKSAFIAVIVNL
ncbi:hypothetical protein ACE38W_17990 [Chitinophaga sp. Hz27]